MKIKKGWKITWISLGSLLGVVLLAVGVAIWILCTPSQLTKLVNRLAGKYLDCDAHFEYVELTLFSTFPDVGLNIKNVTLVKKMDGAPNDTLAYIGDVTVGLDLMAYLKHDQLIVHQVYLDDTKANLYIDKEGRCNFDIIPPSEDTTESKPPELIDLKKIEVRNLTARLKDERDGIDAEICDLALTMDGRINDDDIVGRLQADCRKASMETKDSTGRSLMVADVDHLTLGANIDKEGLATEGEATMGGTRVTLTMNDSTGTPSLATVLDGFTMQLNGDGGIRGVDGMLALKVENGTFDLGEKPMVNESLQKAPSPLLHTEIPFHYSIISKKLTLDESVVDIADVNMMIGGEVKMDSVMNVDLALHSVGEWPLGAVLSYIPDVYASFREGMDADGPVLFEGTFKGPMGGGMIPVMDAKMKMLGDRLYWPSVLPYRFSGMSGDVLAHLDLNDDGVSKVSVKGLKAKTRDSRLVLTGRLDDLLGERCIVADLKGTLPLRDLYPMLPEGMNIQANGDATVDLQADFALSDLGTKSYEKMNAKGKVKMSKVEVDYDSLHAVMPEINLALAIPAKQHKGKLADVHVTGKGKWEVESGKSRVQSGGDVLDIDLGVNNLFKNNLTAEYNITIGETEAMFDSAQMSTGGLVLKGSMGFDPTGENILSQYNPRFGFSTHDVTLITPQLPETLHLIDFAVDYRSELCEILSAQVMMGHTDLDLFGQVENLDQWLMGQSMLRGYLNLTSEYADVDQMMDLFSGAGSNPDSLEAMRREDTVPADANPFIVPKNVDFTVQTNIKQSVAFGNDLRDVSGELTVKDGVAVLEQMGFVCKAARMQLTAIYKSPRPNNLFASIDFHLLDIQIDELLDMIPCVDTLVPMLKAFDGNADFHLAGESFLDARYQPKMSSLLGSAAISGKDLVVMEDKSISNTAKLIGLKSWKDDDNKIKIDSLSVEMTCFRKEIEVYPFLLNMGKYSFCISGVHTLDNFCNYHIELLKNPLIAKIGVDIKGSLSDPKISLGSVRYGDFYKPEKKEAASKKALELKAMIRRELERNVR